MGSFITLNSNDNKGLATVFRAGGVSNDDPFSDDRQIAFDDGRTRAGIAGYSGAVSIRSYPHWEMVIVTEGSLAFSFDTTRTVVAAGGTLVINKGARFSVQTAQPARWVFLSVTPALEHNPEPAVLTFFDRDAGLYASPSLNDEILVSAAPTCRNHRMHVRDDMKIRAGLWDSTPYERIFIEQQEHELMHITKGEVTFSDSEGNQALYTPGETFLVPKGVNGKWTSKVHVAKNLCGGELSSKPSEMPTI